MHLEANLEIPDALALAAAVASGAEHLAKLGSTDTVDGRRATALADLARHQPTIGFDDPDDEGPESPQAAVPAKPVTQVVLYAHLSADAITRFDHPDASGTAGEVLCGRLEQANQRLVTVEQVRAWCGRPDVQVVINQVIDLRERLECRGYHPTPEIREHAIARDGTCVFPWCGRNARHCDLDHVIPYNHNDPERGGPTSTDNLAALCRHHHRLKTHGRWRYEMTEPGVFVWTSPLGNTYLRDHTGSRPTGRAWPQPGDTTGPPATTGHDDPAADPPDL
jgi:hypothetical protein